MKKLFLNIKLLVLLPFFALGGCATTEVDLALQNLTSSTTIGIVNLYPDEIVANHFDSDPDTPSYQSLSVFEANEIFYINTSIVHAKAAVEYVIL